MASIQAVTFNIVNTLLLPYTPVGKLYAACAKKHGIEINNEVFNTLFPVTFNSFPHNSSPKLFLKEVVKSYLSLNIPTAKLDEISKDFIRELGKPESWRLGTGAIQAITAIRFLGIKVGILSNTDESMRTVLSEHGILKHLDGIFLSSEIKLYKPDPRAFMHASHGLNSSISGLVHFGNNPFQDAQGARDAGATGIIIGDQYVPEGCFRCDSLMDTPMFIRAMITKGKTKSTFSRNVQNLLANLRGLPEDRGRSTDRQLKPIDNAILEAFKALRIDKIAPENVIIANWNNILPPKLAKQTSPARIIIGGKLVVRCENSIIKSELKFLERVILLKIRSLPACRDVKSIHFVVS